MFSLKILLIPALVLAGGLLLAACAPLPTLNALIPPNSNQLDEAVSYGKHPRQKIDIYRPAAKAPANGYPMVVFFYGGSWNTGERSQYKFVGQALASRGILTLVADYRLYPEVSYPDFLEDSAGALAYAMRESSALGADSSRIFVMGHSAGAYNAAMLALDDRWLKAQGEDPKRLAGWIGLAGPYDFLPIKNPDAKPVFHHPNYPPDSQPIDFAGAGSPATFLGAARDDKLVNPQRNSAQLAERLQAAKVPVDFRLYPRASHVTLVAAFAWPLRWIAPVLDDVSGFIAVTPARLATAGSAADSAILPALATNGAR